MAEDEGDPGIPEWVVTFGDMMSLLLTFFIMLVSLSEIKEDEKYQAMLEAIQKQFGYSTAQASMAPGKMQPRNSTFSSINSAGRSKRLDTHQGGDKTPAPVGENPEVRIIRPGQKTAVGTVVYFEEGSIELTDDARQVLRRQAEELAGKPQKIEIRGHTSRRPVESDDDYQDHWGLGFRRCRQVMRHMVEELAIEASRIRIGVAGANEPAYLGEDPTKLGQNPRVEVFMLDETVADLSGTPDERASRYRTATGE